MRGERAYLVVCAALVGWALGYALPSFSPVPSLYLDPQPGRWSWGGRPGAVAMGYYGQVLWGLAGAAVGGLVGRLAAGRAGDPEGAGARAGVLAAWALSALLLCGAWFTWSNWP